MNRILLVLALSLAAGLLLFAQRPRPVQVAVPAYLQWELQAIQPRETAPARYRQVEQAELDRASREGWELVSVAPYVIFNEERGPEGHKVGVTQTYPAYYFKRAKILSDSH